MSLGLCPRGAAPFPERSDRLHPLYASRQDRLHTRPIISDRSGDRRPGRGRHGLCPPQLLARHPRDARGRGGLGARSRATRRAPAGAAGRPVWTERSASDDSALARSSSSKVRRSCWRWTIVRATSMASGCRTRRSRTTCCPVTRCCSTMASSSSWSSASSTLRGPQRSSTRASRWAARCRTRRASTSRGAASRRPRSPRRTASTWRLRSKTLSSASTSSRSRSCARPPTSRRRSGSRRARRSSRRLKSPRPSRTSRRS